ncbi:MAG TPA: hypothetical protein P5048_00850 [Chlamydiales bacterium]|nr:hypothetical protein [Chlamydiales bacterium]
MPEIQAPIRKKPINFENYSHPDFLEKLSKRIHSYVHCFLIDRYKIRNELFVIYRSVLPIQEIPFKDHELQLTTYITYQYFFHYYKNLINNPYCSTKDPIFILLFKRSFSKRGFQRLLRDGLEIYLKQLPQSPFHLRCLKQFYLIHIQHVDDVDILKAFINHLESFQFNEEELFSIYEHFVTQRCDESVNHLFENIHKFNFLNIDYERLEDVLYKRDTQSPDHLRILQTRYSPELQEIDPIDLI